jgi:hypothetical protein
MELSQNLDLQLDLHIHALKHSSHGIKSKLGLTDFGPTTHEFRHSIHVELNQNLNLQTLDLHIHALKHSIHGIKSKPRLTKFGPIDSCI